jgi:hypothetical protein
MSNSYVFMRTSLGYNLQWIITSNLKGTNIVIRINMYDINLLRVPVENTSSYCDEN